MSRPGAPKHAERGFVLVLTLLVLVIVAIAASTFAEKVASAVELAQKSRQNTQTIIDMAATRAEILYRLGTTSITMDGLGRGNTLVALDNRPYRGLGDTLVHLQDNRGLLNLNQTNDDRLLRFLGIMGIPAEQRSHLIDTLRDYIDADKLEHLNGAEEPQYLARQLVPPTNNYLTTPWEVRRIIGWRDAPQLWQNSRFIDLTTTSTMGGLNPNTAPVEVLATLPGMTEELAQTLVLQRQQAPIMHTGQLAAMAGIPEQLLDMQIMVLPSNSLRVTQSVPGLNWRQQYSVSLTPNGDQGPWRIDYFTRVSPPAPVTANAGSSAPAGAPSQASSAPADIAPLPPRSTAAPETNPMLRFGG
jgi:DNA uptake protein ComE-like DNA-binding protein